MSLLPNTILPPSMPFGRFDAEKGLVIIEQNWWLFLYNLSLNVLGTPGITSLSASALLELSSLESDANDTDAIISRQGISNAAVQTIQAADVVVSDADLPSIARVLLLAQDVLLPDPAPAAQPVKTITVGASPFTYTAPFNGNVAVTGGTVSAISIIRQGVSVATGLITGLIPASRADQIQVTYTGIPTMTFIPT